MICEQIIEDRKSGDMRAEARRGLTSVSALRIKALLVTSAGSADRSETIELIESHRGHLAEPAEVAALTEALARSTGSDRNRSGSSTTPLRDCYPELMSSEFGSLIERIQVLAQFPD